MSYRLASAIAAHPRVRALTADQRAGYFVMWDRCADPLGMTEKELCALLLWTSQGRSGADTLTALRTAGLVVSISDTSFPISPALFDDLDLWNAESGEPQFDVDTRTAIEISREVGMLGELSGEQWRELMDFVARRRMGMVAG